VSYITLENYLLLPK